MTIVVYTDASSKNGYSCWVFKSSLNNNYKFGIIRTMNIAAAETIAAINAIVAYAEKKQPILIISDSLITVRIIQQQNEDYVYSNKASKYYRKVRDNLISLLVGQDIDAVHVYSKNTNKHHIEVDHIAKTELDKFLKTKGLLC